MNSEHAFHYGRDLLEDLGCWVREQQAAEMRAIPPVTGLHAVSETSSRLARTQDVNPMPAATRQRLIEHIELMTLEPPPTEPIGLMCGDDEDSLVRDPDPSDHNLPTATRNPIGWAWVASHLAAAAAAALVTLMAVGPWPTKFSAHPPLTGFDQPTVNFEPVDGFEPDASPRLMAHSEVKVEIDLHSRVSPPVELYVEARSASDVSMWIPILQASTNPTGPFLTDLSNGTLHFEGALQDVLPLGHGQWELSFAIGRPGACPSQKEPPQCHYIGTKTIRVVPGRNRET